MDNGISVKEYYWEYIQITLYTDTLKSYCLGRKKTSLTLDEKTWSEFQTYALKKHGNTRNANTELEYAMQEYMKNNPLRMAK